MHPLIAAFFWISCVLALAVERQHNNTNPKQSRKTGLDRTRVVDDIQPINVVYHVQITPTYWCGKPRSCFIGQQGAKQEVLVEWHAGGRAKEWDGPPGTIPSLDVDVTFHCEAPAGEPVCAWMRTPYKEYTVRNFMAPSPENPMGHNGGPFSMRSPSSTRNFEVYCVVGKDNCRNEEGDNYYQYDGLDEYHWHW